jgi:DNA ligase-1
LVREPFRRRRELLKTSFKEIEGEFMFVQSIDTANIEDIQVFMDDSMKGNHGY